MKHSYDSTARWPQFTIRTALGATLLTALALGWYSSSQRGDARISRLSARVKYFEAELERSKSRNQSLEWIATRPHVYAKRGPLWSAELNGTNLRAVTIVGGVGAFSYASFINCDLQEASLTGGTSSFQGSQFDRANLVDAKLTGGSAAFQGATFAKADLSGAVLTGGGSAFQASTLEGAKLLGTKLVFSGSSFQCVNINGAQFQGADLSTIDRYALESCYFDTPPTYDEKTKFPAGFDPCVQRWANAGGQQTRAAD